MLIPGRKVNMIFSFCQIRQFSETTELLQEEIIVFVNTIVEIIHKVGQQWEGVPTNNSGDRYVITWRLPTMEDAKKAIEAAEKEDQVEEDDSNKDEHGEEVKSSSNMLSNYKEPRPDAPWLKDEVDDFEDLEAEQVT